MASTVSSSTTSVVIPGRSGLVVMSEDGSERIGKEATVTVLAPEFNHEEGTIKGVVLKNQFDGLTVTLEGFLPVHPIEVLGRFFPMVAIRHTGYQWCMVGCGGSVDGVKILVLHDGKVFGIKA